MRLDARIANHRKRVARRAAFRIVVDDDVGGHSADSARAVEPSVRPISLSFRSITISSMLSCGSARNSEMRFDRKWSARSRSEEHTSELQSLMRISYAVFCLKKKNKTTIETY